MINIGDAVLTITGDIKDLNTKLGEVNKSVQSSIGNITNESRKIGVAFTLVGGAIVAGLGLAAKAAADEEVGIKRLSVALKNVGVEYDSVKDSLEGVIAATTEKTAVSDDEQRESIAGLVAITGDYQKSLDLLPLALDLAAGKGMDLASASQVVGRVSEGNTAILTRYGIQIREGATATEALGLLQQKYAGQAAAYGRTTAGQFTIIKNSIDDLVETIGASLLPVVKSLIAIVKPVIDGLRGWVEGNRDAANAILLVAGGIGAFMVLTGPLLIALPSIVSGITLLSGAAVALGFSLTALAIPLLALTAGLAILSLGLILLADVNSKNARATVLNKEAVEEYNKLLAGEANGYRAVLEQQIALIESYPELHENDLEWIKNAKERLAILKEGETAGGLERGRLDAQIQSYRRFYGILEGFKTEEQKSLMDKARDASKARGIAIDGEIRDLRTAHDIKVGLLQDEYDEKLRTLNAETNEAVRNLESQITAIDAQTAAEEAIKKAASDEERRNELQTAVNSAKDNKERAAAQKELDAFLAQLETERVRDEREKTKNLIRERISALQDEAQKNRERLAQGLQTEIETLDGKLTALTTELEAEKKLLDTVLEEELVRIELERKAVETAEKSMSDAEVARINAVAAAEVAAINAVAAAQQAVSRPQVPGGGGTSPTPTPTPATPGFSLNEYATGGIISEPTLLTSIRTMRPYAVAGEAGPERVSPIGASRVMITGNNFYVRQESDIDRIGESIVRKIRLTQGLRI